MPYEAEGGRLFAAVHGTLIVNTGDVAKDKDGNPRLDDEKQEIPVLENINFSFPLDKVETFKTDIQAMIIEALTLKNWEIAKENGQLSHFIAAVGGNPEETNDKAQNKKPAKKKKSK